MSLAIKRPALIIITIKSAYTGPLTYSTRVYVAYELMHAVIALHFEEICIVNHHFICIVLYIFIYLLLFPSQCPSGSILSVPLTQYSMVWDWRVSRAGSTLFYWPSCSIPYYSLLLFFHFSSFCL